MSASTGTPLPKIGAPATRALEGIGVTTVQQLGSYTEREILALHGVGPKAIRILAPVMTELGVRFREEPPSSVARSSSAPGVIRETFMHDRNEIAARILAILDDAGARYTLYDHRPVLTYDDIALVAQETGWQGTEMKNLVQKAGDEFVVYVTLQGTRADTKAMKKHLGTKKVRMASDEELEERFGAEPGNAYPFGFDVSVRIIVDPAVYEQEWLLFSPCRPDQTVQVCGADLAQVFGALPNQVEALALNQG